MSRESRNFLTLDGLRGVAALAIAIRHAPFLWREEQPTEFLNDSYLAVDFFFLLSGFVIAHAYGQRLRGEMSFAAFALARFRRLYPLYALAVALSVVSLVIGLCLRTTSIRDVAANLAFAVVMLPAPFSGEYLYPLDSPAWSLFFELVANALFALTVVRWPRAGLMGLVFLVAAGLVAAASNTALGFGASDGPLNAGAYWSGFGAGLLRVGVGFFGGVLLYRLYVGGVRLPAVPAPWLCVLLFFILAVWVPRPLRLSYDLISVFVLFPAIVLVGAAAPARGVWADRFHVFGGMSYALYVLQAPLYKLLVWAALIAFGFDLARIPMFVGFVGVMLAVGLAILADRNFEAPISRALFRRRPRSDCEKSDRTEFGPLGLAPVSAERRDS